MTEDERKVLAEFTKIPGIGLVKAKKLYEAGYRSIDDLKKASFEELASIKGFGEENARKVKEYLGKKEPVKKVKKLAVEVEEERKERQEEKKDEISEMEKEIMEMERELKETEEFIERSKVSTVVFEKKVKKEEGFINGVKARPVKMKKARKSKGYKIGAWLFTVFLLFSSIFVLWYALQPAGKIRIDGSIDDWQGIARYTDTTPAANPDINVNEYAVYYENDKVNFYAKVSGSIFSGANNGYDVLLIFVDTDGNKGTGYRIENIGADAKIEIDGYGNEIRSATVSRFVGGNELNYSAWENSGEVRVEKTSNLVEGYAKIAGLNNPVSLVVMRHYEGNNFLEKRGMALVGTASASLVIYQNFVGSDVVNESDKVLELRLIGKGGDVHIDGLAVANADFVLSQKDIAMDREIVVECRAKALEPGKAYSFSLDSVQTNVPYRIVGNGGKAYFGSLPQGIVIDGAFGDWHAVSKGIDAKGDASKNIDLIEYASAMASDAYFYLAVDGSMLAGCEIPALANRPQPGPPGPVVLKENLGLDIARVYIDLMNSTINTFNPAMISYGYLVELQGRNGVVISAKAYRWENGAKAGEIENAGIVYGLSNGKIEFSVSGSAISGIASDTKFYFEMTNWLGQRDASEPAYKLNQPAKRVGGDGSYSATARTDFLGGEFHKVVLVNDRYTSTTKGALRLENNTVAYTPVDGNGDGSPDTDENGNLTVTAAVTWSSGTYYFRHLTVTSTGNITASGYMTVIRIYAEVIEIYGTIYLAGKGGKGGDGGTGSGGDGYTGQDGNDGTGPSASSNGQPDGGGGGGGVVMNYNGGWGGGGGGFAGAGGNGGRGAYDGSLGYDGYDGYYGRGGLAYASQGTLKPGSGGGGGSSGYAQTGNFGAGGAGGYGGGAIHLSAWDIYIAGKIIASGTNGGDGGSNLVPGAGGGGGSGGCILIQGCNVTIDNAELNVSGGNGGNSGDDISGTSPDDEAAGGGGGGGGAIWIYADRAYREIGSPIFNISGGKGGQGSYGSSVQLPNNGTDGADGQLIKPTPGTPPKPSTTYTSPFAYSPTGNYISPVLDAGRISFWKSINVSYDTHWAGTSVEVYYRVWNYTEPSTWNFLGTLSGGGGYQNSEIPLPESAFGRFLRYNLTLKTTFSTMPGWPYRMPIRINNNANPQTLWNYTINFTIDTASHIAQGKMRTDCGDIRFTDASGNLIPYWIESGINTDSTLIWVKVPRIEANGVTPIYMYYGNLSAQSIANASQTFLFYDDFESGTLDKWSTPLNGIWGISTNAHTGSYAMVANGYSGSTRKYIVAKNLDIQNVIFEAWWRLSTTALDISQCVRASMGTPISEYEVDWAQSYWALAKKISGGSWTPISTTTASPPSANTWFKVTLYINSTNMKFLKDDSQVLPSSGWQYVGNELANGSIAFTTWNVSLGNYWWIDDVRVRNFTAPEPIATPGTDSPTIYSINVTYHKPKLLIKEVNFIPSGKHSVVLYNNDTVTLQYKYLYLNTSKNSYTISELTLNPAQELNIPLENFFNDPTLAGDFLFLNDSTSGISGNAPNGIIDFVNWTDIYGNPPPSDEGIGVKNLEWIDGPVDLSTAQSMPESIKRNETNGVAVDTDAKEDWYVDELYLSPLVPFILSMYLLLSRKTRKPKFSYILRAGRL